MKIEAPCTEGVTSLGYIVAPNLPNWITFIQSTTSSTQEFVINEQVFANQNKNLVSFTGTLSNSVSYLS